MKKEKTFSCEEEGYQTAGMKMKGFGELQPHGWEHIRQSLFSLQFPAVDLVCHLYLFSPPLPSTRANAID